MSKYMFPSDRNNPAHIPVEFEWNGVAMRASALVEGTRLVEIDILWPDDYPVDVRDIDRCQRYLWPRVIERMDPIVAALRASQNRGVNLF